MEGAVTARRTKTPEARPTDRQILQEIETALREWAKFYGPGVDRALQRSEGAEVARTAMSLMVHNLRLLKRCRDNCSWDPEMNMVFTCLGKAEIDWDTMKHGDFRGWAGYFVGPLAFPGRRSFLDQVIRWAEELERMEKEAGGPAARQTRFAKLNAIAGYLEAHPKATSEQVGAATGLDPSNVRHLWTPIKKALKEAKRPLRRGWKEGGQTHVVDESASCQTCDAPLAGAWECKLCKEIITGECRTCHFTNAHPDEATP